MFLIMKNRNETREVPISMDMRKIQAGTRICGKTVIKLMEGRVSLKLQRKKDGLIIHFANKNSTDTLYLEKSCTVEKFILVKNKSTYRNCLAVFCPLIGKVDRIFCVLDLPYAVKWSKFLF